MTRKAEENTPSSLPPAPEGAGARLLWAMRLAPRMPFVWLMRLYRLLISPLYGDVCRYYPSCSKYALDAFEVRGAIVGAAMTVWRLLRCNPFSSGGVDYVEGSVLHRRSEAIRAAQGTMAQWESCND